MPLSLQLCFVLGSLAMLLIVFALLKKNLLTVKYSLLWLAFSAVMLVFAACPYVVYVLRDLLNLVMPVNLVYLLLFCFVLLVLLSISIAISQLAEKNKRLAQANALLEERVRRLEQKLQEKNG